MSNNRIDQFIEIKSYFLLINLFVYDFSVQVGYVKIYDMFILYIKF